MTSTPATRPSGPVDDCSVAADAGAPATAGNVASSGYPAEADSDDVAVVVGGEALTVAGIDNDGTDDDGVVDAVTAAGLEFVVLDRLDEPAPVEAMGVDEAERVGVRLGLGFGVGAGSTTIGAHSERG